MNLKKNPFFLISLITDCYLIHLFLLMFSYRQNLAVDFIVAELAFETLDKFYEFVSEFGLIYADPQKMQIDCKASSGTLGSW